MRRPEPRVPALTGAFERNVTERWNSGVRYVPESAAVNAGAALGKENPQVSIRVAGLPPSRGSRHRGEVNVMRESPRRPRRNARVEYALPRRAASARWARQLTTGFLTGSRTPPEAARGVEEARLVASELVTNATLHGRGRCRLRLSSSEGTVTVEVRDDGVRLPRMHRAGQEREGGRGIAMVSHLARRLDVTAAPGGGKTVSAVLDAA